MYVKVIELHDYTSPRDIVCVYPMWLFENRSFIVVLIYNNILKTSYAYFFVESYYYYKGLFLDIYMTTRDLSHSTLPRALWPHLQYLVPPASGAKSCDVTSLGSSGAGSRRSLTRDSLVVVTHAKDEVRLTRDSLVVVTHA